MRDVVFLIVEWGSFPMAVAYVLLCATLGGAAGGCDDLSCCDCGSAVGGTGRGSTSSSHMRSERDNRRMPSL